jgi:hypothetical protein
MKFGIGGLHQHLSRNLIFVNMNQCGPNGLSFFLKTVHRMNTDNFYLNCFPFGEYSMKYKENCFLFMHCDICDVISFPTTDLYM